LIIKRGGHSDQLSGKYWGLDRFRIKAILRLLAQKDLDEHIHKRAIATLQEKCRIVANGYLKRGKKELAENFIRIAARYS
jgi:hypothetical protein